MKLNQLLSILFGVLLSIQFGGCIADDMEDEYVCNPDGYIEYKKITYNPNARSEKEMYVIEKGYISEEDRVNVAFVLKTYNMDFKTINNKLMIRCELWKDKDALSNITKKANDQEWLDKRRNK